MVSSSWDSTWPSRSSSVCRTQSAWRLVGYTGGRPTTSSRARRRPGSTAGTCLKTARLPHPEIRRRWRRQVRRSSPVSPRPMPALTHGTMSGAYLDLESNLTKQVLLNVAGRYEHYSDFGSRVTGKTALRFQPNKQLVLRAAASTGFRAPGLAQSFFSHVTTNFIDGSAGRGGQLPGEQPGVPDFRGAALEGRDIGESQRWGGVSRQWTTSPSPWMSSTSRSITGSCSAPPMMPATPSLLGSWPIPD